jgi:hypothetical protein
MFFTNPYADKYAAVSLANTEAKQSSTATTDAECRVQAGRGVGLNNHPNDERGFVHFITSCLYHTLSLAVDFFRFMCDLGVFSDPCVRVAGIHIPVIVILRTVGHLAC